MLAALAPNDCTDLSSLPDAETFPNLALPRAAAAAAARAVAAPSGREAAAAAAVGSRGAGGREALPPPSTDEAAVRVMHRVVTWKVGGSWEKDGG